jgi:hypothetical protein
VCGAGERAPFGVRAAATGANVRAVFTRRLLLVLDVLCLAGVLWAAALIGALLTGDRLFPTGVAVGVAAALILPGFLAGVVSNRTTFRGRPPRDGHTPTVWRPPVDLPHWALVVAGLVILAFWVAGMSAFAGIDQGSDARDTDHGQRIALGVLGALGVGGTTLAAASLRTGRKPLSGARKG